MRKIAFLFCFVMCAITISASSEDIQIVNVKQTIENVQVIIRGEVKDGVCVLHLIADNQEQTEIAVVYGKCSYEKTLAYLTDTSNKQTRKMIRDYQENVRNTSNPNGWESQLMAVND